MSSVALDPDSATRRQAFVDGLFFRFVACAFLEVVLVVTAWPSGIALHHFLPAALVIVVAAMLASLPAVVRALRIDPASLLRLD